MSLSDNKIVLLAGMHRSGTSALARVWNLLGAALPEPLVPASVGNELGHWEPAEVVALNDRALLAAGSDVNAVVPIAPEWFESDEAEGFREEIAVYCRALLAAFPLTVIKDPRISPLASLWRDGVERAGGRPRFIIASRDPWEIAASLTSRQLKHFPDEVWPVKRATTIWLRYLLSVEEVSRGAPRTFADYAWLMADWRGEIARMAEQLDVPVPVIDDEKAAAVEGFLRPDARRARRERLAGYDPLLASADALIKARRTDPLGGGEDFDALSARFSGAFDVLGGYLAGLEGRAGEITEARQTARRATDEAEFLRRDVALAERRLLHLNRKLDAVAHSAADASSTSGEPDAVRVRLTALTAAHRALTEQVKLDRQAWANEREALKFESDRAYAAQTLELDHAQAARKALATEDDARARAQTQLRRAISNALQLDPADPATTNAKLAAGVRAGIRDLSDRETQLDAARDAAASTAEELGETRQAYESIREEVVALRKRAEAAEAEALALSDELTREIAENATRAVDLHRTLAEEREALQAETEAGREHNAEGQRAAEGRLAALQQSFSWRAVSAAGRMASPLRPVMRALRRS